MNTQQGFLGMAGPIANLDIAIRAYEQLEDDGGQLSPAVHRIINNWRTLQSAYLPTEPEATLTSAVLANKDLTGAQAKKPWDTAMVEVIDDPHNKVKLSVAANTLQALRTQYAQDDAQRNYESAAARFNKTAAALTKECLEVDPNLNAKEVLHLTPKEQGAYLQQAVLAAQLKEDQSALFRAAAYAGVNSATKNQQIALTIDWSQAHRRKVWEAFDAEGRQGRWPALIEARATIHAPETAAEVPVFEDLAKTTTTQHQVHDGHVSQWKKTVTDPEDDDYKRRTQQSTAPSPLT